MRFTVIQLALLAALLVAAAASDAARRRVPNPVAVAVAVLGLSARLAVSGPRAAALGACAGGALLVALALAWRSGVLGGGDVKLAAACAVWTAFDRLPVFLLATALAGGVVAAGFAARRRAASSSPGSAAQRVGAGEVRIPYSFAIGAGALAALLGVP